MNEETFYIKLDTTLYQVKHDEHENRLIFANGKWMEHGDFVDYLCDNGWWGQVRDLAIAAFECEPERAYEEVLKALGKS